MELDGETFQHEEAKCMKTQRQMTLKTCHNLKTEVKHITGEMGKMKLEREQKGYMRSTFHFNELEFSLESLRGILRVFKHDVLYLCYFFKPTLSKEIRKIKSFLVIGNIGICEERKFKKFCHQL